MPAFFDKNKDKTMADPADMSQKDTEFLNEKELQRIHEAASKIPKGHPGECLMCGEYFARLVAGNCARCRDAHDLP